MAHAPDSVYQALFFPLMATGTSYQDQEGEGGEIISHEDESLTYGSLRGVSEQANGQESDFLLIDGGDRTQQALDTCKKWVLTPYEHILKFMGWIPVQSQNPTINTICCRGKGVWVVRAIWILIILTTFITQVLTCFRRDKFLPGTLTNITEKDGAIVEKRVVMCSEHVVSLFILTDILLISSYLFGIYLLYKEDTAEYLPQLAEQVFVKHKDLGDYGTHNNSVLIKRLGIFAVSSVVWLVLSVIVRVMTTISNQLWRNSTIIRWNSHVLLTEGGKVFLLIFTMFGFVFFDLVYLAAVLNYASQSEINIFYLNAVREFVIQKKYKHEKYIDAAVKDILKCKQYLHILNGKTATATALILFNLGSLGIVAIISLGEISDRAKGTSSGEEALAIISALLNIILWIALVSFPFIQAARVSDACKKLLASGPEVRGRPQSYVQSHQLDLDSYVNVVQAIKLRATMFGVPIYPWMVWGALVAYTFTALILFQTNKYTIAKFF